MTAPSVSTITRASFDRDLTNMHAEASAPVLSIGTGTGVEFERALRNARFWPTPWVLQQRDESGTAVISALQVTRSIGDEAEVRLFIPGTGRWQENTITVRLDQMTGTNWYAVEAEAMAVRITEVELAACAADDSRIIPRTAAEARHRARLIRLYAPEAPAAGVLDRMAEWLPGGTRNEQGHELAAQIDLCGEYEAAVCPTLGWLPRRGSGNSRAALCQHWHDALDQIEAEAEDVGDALNRAIARYDRDGIVNRAIVEHAEAHLESHKRPGVNALLSELGMSPISTVRSYEVEVRVERSRTVTEYAIVRVEVEAESEDEAGRLAEDQATDDLYYADWIVEDDHYDSDITDVMVEDVSLM